MPLTENVVLELLRQRHTAAKNTGSGEHAFLTHVRNAAGFSATRTFDAVAVNLWPSRGLGITVYEVKVSRSDWQRELAKPDKAEDACKVADLFVMVCPAGTVKDGELPPAWGLVEVHGDGADKPWKLREKVAPMWLQERTTFHSPVNRGFVVGMLRSAPGAIPGGKVPGPNQLELSAEYERGRKDGQEQAKGDLKRRLAQVDVDAENTKALTDALTAAGLERWEADPSSLARKAPAIVTAIRGTDVFDQLRAARNNLQRVVETIDALTDAKEVA